jgi:hydroxymethylbilane synthase
LILRLASRGSALALWQAEHIRARLEAVDPDLHVEIVVIETTGDRIRDVPLARIGETGLFTREVDRAVLDGRADAAVHSLKDVPTRPHRGLRLAAVPEREDPRDAFIPAPDRPATLAGLPRGARVGTSSLRRRALLLDVRPDLRVDDLRGNLDTRLARVAAGDYDGAILALAGLHRLGRTDVVGEPLEPPRWLPAAGQGALAVVTRDGDAATDARVARLDHAPTRAATTAERTFLNELEGGCQVPIGALGRIEGGALRLDGFVAGIGTTDAVRGHATGTPEAAEDVGRRLARDLLARGADRILHALRAAARGHVPAVPPP